MEVPVRLGESLSVVAQFAPAEVPNLCKHLEPEWILQSLEATGTATVRKRRMPAEQVPWLVIGMALFRDRPIHDVVVKLDLALPGPGLVAPSSIAEARDRLGEEPMEWLFTISAEHWAHDSARSHAWRGLALYGVDGTTLRVPDGPENAAAFGYAHSVRGDSGYPLVRIVGLMALRSHLLAAVEFGDYATSEVAYAESLWPRVPDDSLIIMDRGFFGAGTLIPITREGQNRHWLTRAKKNFTWRVLQRLGRNDELVEMQISSAARAKNPTLPTSWVMRAIRYQRKGFRPQVLLTSLLDPAQYPAAEVVALYHERWELELGFDEIKTEMLDHEMTIRSRRPVAVRQELWGIFLAYNLVRLEMERVADELDLEPTQISFAAALRLICDEWLWCAIASPGAIPKNLRNLRMKLAALVLPPRRSGRSYPRAVKVKMSNYPRKRRDQARTAPRRSR